MDQISSFDLDLLETDTVRDPYPLYATWRQEGSAIWHPRLESWLLPRYRDCVAVFRDLRHFTADPRRLSLPIPPSAVSIQTMDPPEHTPVRTLLASALRAQNMAALEKRISEHAARLLASFVRDGGGEVMGGFALPLALGTICDVLGVQTPNPRQFGPTSDAIIRSMDSGLNPALEEPGRRARAELSALVASWFDGGPREGMMGYLADRAGAADVAPDVIHNSVRVAFHAGYTTVYSALGSAVLALLRHEYDWRSLRSHEERETAVEELLRYDGPVQVNSRTCVEDVDIAGVSVRRGQTVLLMLGSANHDPDEFARPDELVFDRRPNRHLAFGWGIHACIGGLLARTVLRIALSELAARTRDVRLAGPVEHKPQITQRCLHRIPISCSAPAETS